MLSGYVQSANANAAKTDVGQPVASFFGYVTDGIFQTPEEMETHAFQSTETAPGDIRFKDLDGNGVIDVNDRTYIGNPTPRFTYGFNTDFAWKGIELNIFFQGSQGNDIYVNTVRYDFTYVNRPSTALHRWTGSGTSNSEPRVNLSDPNQNARVSDRFVEDGSYLRLKTLQLGSNIDAVSWPACGEIDIMELTGDLPNRVLGTVHYGADFSQHQYKSMSKYLSGTDNFQDEFHVFSINWEEDLIQFLVDDEVFHTITPASLNGAAYPFNKNFFFVFNVAVGGNLPGNPDASTPFPQSMIVDYVRVFQK